MDYTADVGCYPCLSRDYGVVTSIQWRSMNPRNDTVPFIMVQSSQNVVKIDRKVLLEVYIGSKFRPSLSETSSTILDFRFSQRCLWTDISDVLQTLFRGNVSSPSSGSRKIQARNQQEQTTSWAWNRLWSCVVLFRLYYKLTVSVIVRSTGSDSHTYLCFLWGSN
jgi:hypothetical protein